jgi:D-glycero-D-manno-heptose 1,7-bisphosphate phosphatase
VFLDRDGVLIEDRNVPVLRPENMRILPGVPEALRLLKSAGYSLVVTTNQAVVARGLISEEQLAELHEALDIMLQEKGAPPLDAIYVCPHHPEATLLNYRKACDCRKPRPGHLLQAARDLGLDLAASVLVGDRLTDIEAGCRAGCQTVLLQGPRTADAPIVTVDAGAAGSQPDFTCTTLAEAARWLVAQGTALELTPIELATNQVMTCNICGAAQPEVLFHAKDYEYGVPGTWKIVRCRACGLLAQDPLPVQSEIGRFYPPSYSAYNSKTIIGWMSRMVYVLDARRISRLVPHDGRILDVGCGNGAALLALRERGYLHLTGLEIDPTAAQRARDFGLDVRCGELLGAEFADASFDLIRMGHVIEHVLDPMATLRCAHRLLKPGGILMGETPNTACLDWRIFKQYWGPLHLPRHIFIFNDRNLRHALEQAGFADVEMSYGLRTVGWSCGVQNLLADRAGLRIPPSGRVAWYSVLIALFLPFTLTQAAFGKTATLAYRGRKPIE